MSFAKIRRSLGFEPRLSVEAGIQEVRNALLAGVIKDLSERRYRNAHFIAQ